MVITKGYVVRPQLCLNPINHNSGTVDLIITAALRVIGHHIHRHRYGYTASWLCQVHMMMMTDKRRRAHLVGQGWNSSPCHSERRDCYIHTCGDDEANARKRRVTVIPPLLDDIDNRLALQRITCSSLRSVSTLKLSSSMPTMLVSSSLAHCMDLMEKRMTNSGSLICNHQFQASKKNNSDWMHLKATLNRLNQTLSQSMRELHFRPSVTLI
jgi:hypothetical protein